MTTTQAVRNPLVNLQRFGQSVWLDFIRRSLITSGELRRLIDEDGLRGMTSNPAIFEKAIAGSSDYADILDSLGSTEHDPKTVYERIAIRDVQAAADVLAVVYESTKRRDGYVSLEVSPLLARDTAGTIQEARRLWQAATRPNVMIKVPGTPEGIVALRQLIGEGININVTLLFAQAAYEKVADAYLAGLEDRASRGQDLSGVASVASFFVSRIDTAVEAAAKDNPAARDLVGRVAIANAKLAYQHFCDLVTSNRWAALAAKGAQSQRLLWASTSSKNPAFRDVLYVEELIGEDTVNTIPPATFDAFRDHGAVRASLTDDIDGARETMQSLERAGVSMDRITAQLLADGIDLFADAFDRLLKATGSRIRSGQSDSVNGLTFALPQAETDQVRSLLAEWRAAHTVRRLWDRDASVWTSADESRWLGWLTIVGEQLAQLDTLNALADEVKAEAFTHAVLLGMGGSSLCPEVLRLTFGKIAGFPDLQIVDSTDPAQIKAVEERVDLARTLFIVSSKSGSTLEPNIFKQYFYDRVTSAVGEAAAGRRFIAVTDPGSNMERVAKQDGFRHVCAGVPSIGGRYSALSAFGMVPAAIMGLDVARFLKATEKMVRACGPDVAPEDNPGVVLGSVLGVLAQRGRDKVTLISSPGIGDLGAWLEQLLAESTGKGGRGLIPVDGEPLGSPPAYADDRLFVYVRLQSAPDAKQDAAVDAIERSGQPVVRISVADVYDLGQEFFRWEIATAVAGSIIGINPFDQPDVEASKIATRRLTEEFERTGVLPAEKPVLSVDGITLFADERNAAALTATAGRDRTLRGLVSALLDQLADGDYFALLAYIEMNAANIESLTAIRSMVRDSRRVATCLGFGPRFLHSTGQAYKGGPNTGVFLQITCDDPVDLQVPGRNFTFSVVKAAQARGDLEVLNERGRRALRVHLADVRNGLAALTAAVEQALA
jgi:transaldolase/glucose-6-phosphate isomerase